jgi:LL-diaminopimelate aminotransferase
VPDEIIAKSKMMFINYPNNPTSAVATDEFFKEAVSFAESNNIIICHDAAYTELAFDGYKPSSFLETEGAKDVGIEFHSLSKTYNMTGWRIGFAVGKSEIIQALGQVKSNIDSGSFQAIQMAGMAALEGDQTCIEEINKEYASRRDILVDGLVNSGFSVEKPRATFYLWIEVPEGYSSQETAGRLLTEAGIVVTPGNGFGAAGEGYIRIALTVGRERLKEVIERIGSVSF